MPNIAIRIREARLREGRTQAWLASQLGVSQTAIALWERGTRQPTVDIIEKIAKLLNVTPSFIMGWQEDDEKIDRKIDELIECIKTDVSNQDDRSALVDEIRNLMEKQKEIEEKTCAPHTLAAHFDGDEFTEEELEEIRRFAEFVKSKRKE